MNWPVMLRRSADHADLARDLGSTCGDEITLSSSTIATRRRGSPGAAQAAFAVSCSHARAGVTREFDVRRTSRARPADWCRPRRRVDAFAAQRGRPELERLPALIRQRSACRAERRRVEGQLRGAADHLDGLVGFCTPGSSTMIRLSPERASIGSATPSASTLRRSTSRVRSVAAASAVTVGESWVSRTIWVPPRRSSPSAGRWSRTGRRKRRGRPATAAHGPAT